MLGAIFDKWWSQSELKSYFVEKKRWSSPNHPFTHVGLLSVCPLEL